MALTATVTETGVSVPTYAEVLADLQAKYRGVYGPDVYLEPDSQDGQLLGIQAQAITDANAALAACYNAFSPGTAQGEGLSSVVKVNGIRRQSATYSTADLTITGNVGAVINQGRARDTNDFLWALPATVVIPAGGVITVTATCMTLGAVSAGVGAINVIATPTYGWVSVTNALTATEGVAVETDAALRRRQKTSVALPSLSIFDGLVGAVANVAGVTRYRGYENDGTATDANGLPAHSVALVVEGGTGPAIAQTIAAKKGPGVYTAGTSAVTIPTTSGGTQTIRFYRPVEKPVLVEIDIQALTGFVLPTADLIQQAVADYINGLDIGVGVLLGRLFVPANLAFGEGSESYNVVEIRIAFSPDTPTAASLNVLFNQVASCDPADVTISAI